MFNWFLGIQSALAGSVTTTDPAAGAAPSAGAALVQMLLPMVLIVGVFYFLMIRPVNVSFPVLTLSMYMPELSSDNSSSCCSP